MYIYPVIAQTRELFAHDLFALNGIGAQCARAALQHFAFASVVESHANGTGNAVFVTEGHDGFVLGFYCAIVACVEAIPYALTGSLMNGRVGRDDDGVLAVVTRIGVNHVHLKLKRTLTNNADIDSVFVGHALCKAAFNGLLQLLIGFEGLRLGGHFLYDGAVVGYRSHDVLFHRAVLDAQLRSLDGLCQDRLGQHIVPSSVGGLCVCLLELHFLCTHCRIACIDGVERLGIFQMSLKVNLGVGGQTEPEGVAKGLEGGAGNDALFLLTGSQGQRLCLRCFARAGSSHQTADSALFAAVKVLNNGANLFALCGFHLGQIHHVPHGGVGSLVVTADPVEEHGTGAAGTLVLFDLVHTEGERLVGSEHDVNRVRHVLNHITSDDLSIGLVGIDGQCATFVGNRVGAFNAEFAVDAHSGIAFVGDHHFGDEVRFAYIVCTHFVPYGVAGVL